MKHKKKFSLGNNISCIFLLPSIELPIAVKNKFTSHGFVNTFLDCKKLKYDFPIIYLLFEPEEFNKKYLEFEEHLRKNENYLEAYDLSNNLVLYVYKIPNKYLEDYKLFIEGKYSCFTPKYKSLFPDKVKGTSAKSVEKSPFHHIFNKTEYLRDRWREKLGYTDRDEFPEGIELYERLNELHEEIKTSLEL